MQRCDLFFNSQNIWRLFFKFSLFHWLYTQNGINLFSLGQHFKNQKTHQTLIFGSKNGCNLVTTLFTPLLTERGAFDLNIDGDSYICK